MTQRAAVTGASGFIGRVLTSRLETRTRLLRGLFRSRSGQTEEWAERGLEIVSGDLGDDDALARLVDGVDVVYHLAARRAKDDVDASRRVNVVGTERVARAAAASGARLVYVSTISVYAATELSDPEATAVERAGPGGFQTVTEEVEPRNVELLNPYSATKYAGELALRELAATDEGPEFTVVRPTNVYGPGARAWFLDWVERLERLPVVIGGDVAVDMVHVDDLADGLIRAGESPSAAGEILHMGHETVTLAEYVTRLGDVLDRRVWRLPPMLDRVARVIIEKGHRLLKRNRMSTPLTRSVRFPYGKARRLVGYEPEIYLEVGLERLGRWYRTSGREEHPPP